MIQSYLDSWRKPVFKADLACNDRVGEWFRASGQNGPDTPATQFIYDPVQKEWTWTGLVNYAPGGVTRPYEWVGPDFNPSYAMADIIMFDSLPFQLIDSVKGMYQYNNQQFFLLDGKGWGTQPAGSGHNFSFTMELHTTFTYTGGEVFRFTGDDDVWAFINGQLAMDIGGVHSARSDSIILDNAASKLNLQIGKTYNFDFFYAERHTTASTIRIQTDLFKPRPAGIIVRPDTLPVNPRDTGITVRDTTLTAGQCVKFTLHIVDDTLGLRPEYDSLIQWEIFDSMGNKISFDTVSDTNHLCVTKAYGCIKIRLTFVDPEDATNIIRDSIQLCVQHGSASHLLIESSPLASSSPRNDNPLRTLTIPATAAKDTVYAVLRDPYGNFVSPSQHTAWTIISGASIVSIAGGNAALGAGIITKVGPAGDAWIVASDSTNPQYHDTLHVIVSDIAYDSVRVVTGQGGQKTKITSLTINIGQDTVLRVEGHRIDGLGDHGWQTVSGSWTMSASLRSQTAPPASDSVWSFTPSDTGHGTITVSWGTLNCNVTVVVQPGQPTTMVIYPNDGQPGAQYDNAPYLTSTTYRYQAGTAIPLSAKLFDPINVWLSAYETTPALSNLITWQVVDSATGTFTPAMGSLSTPTGHRTLFTPTMAFRTYLITATFAQGAIRLQYTVRFGVAAGTPAHIVIEASPDSASSPNADNPIPRVDLQSAQTSQPVYAIIRDFYGNYIGHADSALWLSRDTTVVAVAAGPSLSLGEATITRIATAASQTWVVAQLGAMIDSVQVRVTDITYDAVKIMVNSNGLKDVDTLVLRTDQDTTLYALGQRSDTKNWTSVSVAWQNSGVVTNPAAPALASMFTFKPVSPNSGMIMISTIGTGGITVRDTVVVVFLPGLAQKLELYDKPGQPLPADKYPDPTVNDTVVAGTPLPLYAKVFDQNNVWLSQYEQNPSSITWRVQELAGSPPTGTLLSSQGYTTTYTPTKAYNTVYVVAELAVGGNLISDMVKIYVKPAALNHVVIEASPDRTASPNADNPIGNIVFGPADTVRYAYAVLRDVYGNYISAYTQGIWQSLDTTLVKAATGFAANGEGVITRKGNAGDTRVVVHSADFSLADTVEVRLNNISYDSLRIVIGDSSSISQLVLRTDQDTTLWVQGKRSDNHAWEYVPANWKLAGSITTNPTPPQSSINWAFAPLDTGSGIVVVTMGTSVPDTVRVSFQVGLPFRLALYPGANQPNQNTPLPSPVSAIAVAAGDTFMMVARVLDANGNWLSQYANVSAPISWWIEQLSGNPATDSLINTAGYLSSFRSTRAYNNVYVIAQFKLGAKECSDTVQISVTAGQAYHLVVEPNSNWQSSPNHDNPIDSITLLSNQKTASVYAVIRDRFGNFVDYSHHTLWTAADTAVAHVEDGVTSVGEGVISRSTGPGSRTIVQAVDLDNTQLTDSVVVTIANYYYERLRIVVGDSTDIDSLFLTTNDDTTLRIMGLRSDSKTWEYTYAKWQVSGTLSMSPSAPDQAAAWTFYPSAAGSGKIRVTMGMDSITTPDTVRALFIEGPPIVIHFDIITPPEKLIAGDTMLAVVRIQNRTGLIAGKYCYGSGSTRDPAVFQTLLGSGTRPPAVIVVDGTENLLNQFPADSIKNDECFTDGLDTVKVVLYNAPYNTDSVQQLFVKLGSLTAATNGFNLLPAALRAVALQDFSGNDIGDSITLVAPSESKGIMAVGFDRFGNERGIEYCDWTATGSLHTITNAQHVYRIYYPSGDIQINEQGKIIAISDDTSGGVRGDSVFVRITAPPARLVSAVTRDVSGNGLLDEIVLHFSRKVTIQASTAFTVSYNGTVFAVDSVSKPAADSDTVFTLYLVEQQTTDPQSAWLPSVVIRGMPDIGGGDSVLAQDGAGPVVWSVTKTITSLGDRKQDLITVVLSEPIVSRNGNMLSASITPKQMFNVWTITNTGDTVIVASFLDSISSMFKISNDGRTVQFYMANGNDLTDRQLINLRSDTPAVADGSPNLNTPVPLNQRVSVKIHTDLPELVLIVPNPSKPCLNRQNAGTLVCAYNPLARNWVRFDQAGVLMTFKLMPLSGSTEKIRARLMIYDAIGNLVNSASSDDIVPPDWRTGATTAHDMDLYWNGTNQQGMSVATGLYKVFIFLDNDTQKRRLNGTIGITR
ncbi:MAG TPA: fibro-slime domain-containing protein [Chitinivibrionales bacterium]|nr:fibro-slime domain-containing protein [Chitinivibrionales bacterium]